MGFLGLFSFKLSAFLPSYWDSMHSNIVFSGYNIRGLIDEMVFQARRVDHQKLLTICTKSFW